MIGLVSLCVGPVTLHVTYCIHLVLKHAVSVWLALYFLLFTYTELCFLSFLSMEYVLSNVNRLVFNRQLTGVKS